MEDQKFTAIIDGKELEYGLASTNRRAFRYEESIFKIKYLGRGVIKKAGNHSPKNLPLVKTELHFWI